MDRIAKTECCRVVPLGVYLVQPTANSDGFSDGAVVNQREGNT